MSDMLGRSNVVLEISQNCLKHITEDDAYMDMACFNAQQALELLLKHIIECNGIQAPKTHDIDDLIIYAETAGFKYSRVDELKGIADTISKWETKSRYGSGIVTTKEKLNKVYKHILDIRDEFLVGKQNPPENKATEGDNGIPKLLKIGQ